MPTPSRRSSRRRAGCRSWSGRCRAGPAVARLIERSSVIVRRSTSTRSHRRTSISPGRVPMLSRRRSRRFGVAILFSSAPVDGTKRLPSAYGRRTGYPSLDKDEGSGTANPSVNGAVLASSILGVTCGRIVVVLSRGPTPRDSTGPIEIRHKHSACCLERSAPYSIRIPSRCRVAGGVQCLGGGGSWRRGALGPRVVASA